MGVKLTEELERDITFADRFSAGLQPKIKREAFLVERALANRRAREEQEKLTFEQAKKQRAVTTAKVRQEFKENADRAVSEFFTSNPDKEQGI